MFRRLNIDKRQVCIPVFFFLLFFNANAQRYLTGLDSSLFITDTLRPFLKKFENIRISGYMQPQFQLAQADGAPSFEGGNFSQFSKSRFMLRRARLKVDYFLATKQNFPKALFTFQIDATERGVVVKDMFIRLYETKYHNFSITAGFFGRPFGYEVNLGSSSRETPERGRMSQILLPGERDIGIMLSFEPQDKKNKLRGIKYDAGFFNGQGSVGTTDFDNNKDFISRLTYRPFKIAPNLLLSTGLSFLRGGWKNGTKYVFTSGQSVNGDQVFMVDSSIRNLGKASPRHYYGGDVQLKLKHGWGETECRAEYWFGTQPGSAISTTNPGTIPAVNGSFLPTYVRHFDGAFFYFLQNIINNNHQVMIKYDWYDPNIKVKDSQIGKVNTNLTVADIKFSTLGIGYVYHFNTQTKLVLYYDFVKNESTHLTSFLNDIKDNILTCRLQFRF